MGTARRNLSPIQAPGPERVPSERVPPHAAQAGKAQVDLALELGLLSREVEVYVDYTDKWYYGKDVFPANPYITGVHDGPGTNRARKFCALMLASGSTWLFAGVFLTQKGKSKAPAVADAIAKLRAWGFTVKRASGDREVSNYDVIARLAQLDIPYTGTMKKTPGVRPVVDAYLDGKFLPVVAHVLNQNQFTHYKLGPVAVHIIMKTDPGTRARDLRKALRAGKITREEARKKIHVFVTTESPPREKGKLVRWGLAIAQGFRRRWRIESGFRDLNRLFPTSHARSNDSKQLWLVLRMFAFNAWQIQRALRRGLRRVPASWREGPTLQRFGSITTKLFACA